MSRIAKLAHADGWINTITGMGTGRDKRTGAQFAAGGRLSFEDQLSLYRGDGLMSRIIDRPAREMVRAWLDVNLDDAADNEATEEWLRKLRARTEFRTALQWARAYGGAAILMGVKGAPLEQLRDPRPPNAPIDFLATYASQELHAIEYFDGIQFADFGTPSRYQLAPQAVFGPRLLAGGSALPEVHASWLLRFFGNVPHRRVLFENYGWGDPIAQRVIEVCRDFGLTWGAASHLIQDFAQGILTIPGLMEALAADDADAIKKRLEALDMQRSITRMLVLDGGDSTGAGAETFDRKVASLAGLPEIMQQLALLLSSVSDMPVSLLMGQSPAGLNATGASDIRNWYDHVADMQDEHVSPQAERLLAAGFASPNGPTSGKVPPKFSVEMRPLWQLDDVQKADVRSKMAQTDRTYVEIGAITPEEIRTSRFGGDAYSIETHVDVETREAFDATDPTKQTDPTLTRISKPADGEAAPAGDGAPGAADLQALALNGAQITGLLAILQAVRDGTIPTDAAELALQISFPAQVDEQKAIDLVAKIKVRPPEPKPAPGAFPGKPVAAPARSMTPGKPGGMMGGGK